MKTGGSVEPPFTIGKDQNYTNGNVVVYENGQSFTKRSHGAEASWLHPGRAEVSTGADQGFYIAGNQLAMTPDIPGTSLWGVNIFGSYSSFFAPKATETNPNVTQYEFEYSLAGVTIFGRSGNIEGGRSWPKKEASATTSKNPPGREDLQYGTENFTKTRNLGFWVRGTTIMATGSLFSNDLHEGVAILGAYSNCEVPVNRGIIICGVNQHPITRYWTPPNHNQVGSTAKVIDHDVVKGPGIYIRGTGGDYSEVTDENKFPKAEPSFIQFSTETNQKSHLKGHLMP